MIFNPFAERLGGSDNILWSYLRHLDRASIEPVVVFRGHGPFEREVAGLGIRTATVPGGRLRHPVRTVHAVLRLAAILRREDPDLILNWLSTAQVYCAPAAMIAGVGDRCVWWQLDLDRGGPFDRVRMMTRLASLLPARAVGGCSAAVAAEQAQRWPRRPTFAILPGIDAGAHVPESRSESLRSEIGIPPGD